MKKTTPIFHLIACAIISSATFFVCQQEDLSSEELLTANAKASTSLVSETSTATLKEYSDDCSAMCIEEGSNTFYKKSGLKSDGAGESDNSKNLSYDVYNTETELYVYVTYTATGKSSSKIKFTIDINGNEVEFKNIETGVTKFHKITLPENWQACDEIPFSIGGNGDDLDIDDSYALVGICQDTCEESFSYEANDDGSYTFTYSSSEDLTNAEVIFTCPHITDFKALDGKVYDVNPGQSQGKNTVLTWTGNLEACTPITFTLLFEADCNQNQANFANLFTDFKVNEISKKGDAENIKFDCPAE
ncbi:hypothetical protein [Aestuariibaculum lutulentum]|uniref:Uncharacterized protein n=1 Tax=Aestuariibaculum lutulentum TaxID=2920935 RepID=A0ABS9RM06_9FLAO|nr:hypothetical protein [Aestuariibaculum lutulentum]MCH4553985.1 hypothetical protein [Aestuariibaculum lutulentum]